MEQPGVDWFFHTLFALLAATCHTLTKIIFNNVPNPYMDEIFHVPQVQAFCNGSFSQWDSMITTFPGLYLFTVGLLKPLNFSFSTDFCGSLYYLRYINVIFTLSTFYIATLISSFKMKQSFLDSENENVSFHETPKVMSRLSVFEGLIITTFPVLFFFNFLYYTDQGSVFFILLSYYFHLYHSHKLAGFFGACAVMFRQTNVVWVVFIAISAALPTLSGYGSTRPTKFSKENTMLADFLKHLTSIFKSFLSLNPKPLLCLVYDLLVIVWPYLLVVIFFCSFVIHNGSITLGAKEDHQACFHATQVFYFSAFSFAFLFPYISIFTHLCKLITWIKNHMILFIFLLFTTLLTIHSTTHAHRYLLSDNRHYTFYIWKNLFQRHWCIRYILSVVYIFTTYSVWKTVKASNVLWKVAFTTCLSLTLIPSPLLELRYFITPFILLRLNITHPSSDKLVLHRMFLEIVFHAIINSLTIYVFVNKPFTWPGSDAPQRFMY